MCRCKGNIPPLQNKNYLPKLPPKNMQYGVTLDASNHFLLQKNKSRCRSVKPSWKIHSMGDALNEHNIATSAARLSRYASQATGDEGGEHPLLFPDLLTVLSPPPLPHTAVIFAASCAELRQDRRWGVCVGGGAVAGSVPV